MFKTWSLKTWNFKTWSLKTWKLKTWSLKTWKLKTWSLKKFSVLPPLLKGWEGKGALKRLSSVWMPGCSRWLLIIITSTYFWSVRRSIFLSVLQSHPLSCVPRILLFSLTPDKLKLGWPERILSHIHNPFPCLFAFHNNTWMMDNSSLGSQFQNFFWLQISQRDHDQATS